MEFPLPIAGVATVLRESMQRTYAALGDAGVLDVREARRQARRAKFSERQVRYLAAAVARPFHEPERAGDGALYEPVEVALMSVYTDFYCVYGIASRAVWAGLIYNGEKIRAGLRHPEHRMLVQVKQGIMSVVPSVPGQRLDPDAFIIKLRETRLIVDDLIASWWKDRMASSRPWVYSGWRKVPPAEVAVN
jgi:hypothetical protein